MNTALDREPNDLPKGISLQTLQVEKMEAILSSLAEQCPAQRVLLAESMGQVIASGGTEKFANPEGLAALIGGYISAGQAITFLTETKPIRQSILREGLDTITFISEVDQELILFAQVSKTVPLGWARLIIQNACQKLENLMACPPESNTNPRLDWPPPSFPEEADDAFNSLWGEGE